MVGQLNVYWLLSSDYLCFAFMLVLFISIIITNISITAVTWPKYLQVDMAPSYSGHKDLLGQFISSVS